MRISLSLRHRGETRRGGDKETRRHAPKGHPRRQGKRHSRCICCRCRRRVRGRCRNWRNVTWTICTASRRWTWRISVTRRRWGVITLAIEWRWSRPRWLICKPSWAWLSAGKPMPPFYRGRSSSVHRRSPFSLPGKVPNLWAWGVNSMPPIPPSAPSLTSVMACCRSS